MNPALQFLQTIRQQNNPQAFLQQMAQQNPAIARAMEMTNGKNSDEIMQLAENLAKSQGTTLADVRKNLGV